MKEKHLAQSLVRKYHTHDPFQIAQAMDILVIRTPLQGIRGFYQYVKRCSILYIDSNLDEQAARFVCAHELGHALMHRGSNRIFLDTHTHFSVKRYEIEADRFAVELLFDDDDLREFLEHPVQVAADCMGIRVELAQYRLQSIT